MAWYLPRLIYLFSEEQALDDCRGIDFGCDRPTQEPRQRTDEILDAVYEKIAAWLKSLESDKKETLFQYIYHDRMSSCSDLHATMYKFLDESLTEIVREEYALRGLEKGAIFAWPIGAQMSNISGGIRLV